MHNSISTTLYKKCKHVRIFRKLEYLIANTTMQSSLKFLHIWKSYRLAKIQRGPDFMEHGLFGMAFQMARDSLLLVLRLTILVAIMLCL